MFTERIDEPGLEPVTAADAATFCRVDLPVASPPESSLEYVQFLGFIIAARSKVEDSTGRSLITQQWRMTRDHFPGVLHPQNANQNYNTLQPQYAQDPIQLWHGKVQSVESFTIVQPDGTTATLTEDVDFILLNDKLYPALNKCWPSVACAPNAIVIEYTAGYGDEATDVPEGIKLAIMYLVSLWYAERLPIGVEPTSEIGMTYCSLLAPYKLVIFPETK